MIVQRTFLGSRRWTGPWRIRVDTMAGGISDLTVTMYLLDAQREADTPINIE